MGDRESVEVARRGRAVVTWHAHRCKISFVSYHTRAISMNIVRAVAWTLHDAAQKAKGRLCGKRAGSPAALA